MPLGISTICVFGKAFSSLDAILATGIEVLEILDDWEDRLDAKRIRMLREIKGSSRIAFTVHSPLIDVNIASVNSMLKETSLKIIKTSIDHARAIDANLVVVHPGNFTPMDNIPLAEHWDLNRESLRRIISHAEDLGVKIGVENMPRNTFGLLQNAAEFKKLVDEGLPIRMTLDVGHANTTSQLGPLLEMSDLVAHVHLHDNRGLTDEHMPVGDGTVDWKLIRSKIDLGKVSAVVEARNVEEAKASVERVRSLYSS
jgi:sugar phosphate isomerase/epimerase